VEENRLGVIDSTATGLDVVTQRPWLIVIPVLLDLWYWLGPKLSAAPLFAQVANRMAAATAEAMSGAAMDSAVTAVPSFVEALGQRFNLFELLLVGSLSMPNLMGFGRPHNLGVIELNSWLAAIGVGAALGLLGVAIGCLYLMLLVWGLDGRAADARQLLNRAGEAWVRVVATIMLALFFGVSFVVPFLFLVAMVGQLSGGAAAFLMGLFYVGLIWLLIYLFFVVAAIFINRTNPLRAVWYSANVVARNFGSAVGLVLVIMILSQGLGLVWQRLGAAHPIGMLVGIAGHGFIGTALIAATLIFYRDRFRHWQRQAA
jgi:hypothetical protein